MLTSKAVLCYCAIFRLLQIGRRCTSAILRYKQGRAKRRGEMYCTLVSQINRRCVYMDLHELCCSEMEHCSTVLSTRVAKRLLLRVGQFRTSVQVSTPAIQIAWRSASADATEQVGRTHARALACTHRHTHARQELRGSGKFFRIAPLALRTLAAHFCTAQMAL